MKTIKTIEGQTIFDVALENYGTCEAVGEILAANPDILNDVSIMTELRLHLDEFYLDVALQPDTPVQVDPESRLVLRNTLRNLTTTITTYK